MLLHISAIFNKKENFHVSNFSEPVGWKMTVANRWKIDSAEFFQIVEKR